MIEVKAFKKLLAGSSAIAAIATAMPAWAQTAAPEPQAATAQTAPADAPQSAAAETAPDTSATPPQDNGDIVVTARSIVVHFAPHTAHTRRRHGPRPSASGREFTTREGVHA